MGRNELILVGICIGLLLLTMMFMFSNSDKQDSPVVQKEIDPSNPFGILTERQMLEELGFKLKPDAILNSER